MSYYFERYYPLFVSLVIAICVYIFYNSISSRDKVITEFLTSSLTVCATLLGFLLTILTIISTIETRRMRFVRSSGKLHLLHSYLRTALYMNITTISIYFAVPLLYTIPHIANHIRVLHSILIFIVVFTWLANIRFTVIFTRLLIEPNSNVQ